MIRPIIFICSLCTAATAGAVTLTLDCTPQNALAYRPQRAAARRLELAQRRVDPLRDYHLAGARYDAALGHYAAQGKEGK